MRIREPCVAGQFYPAGHHECLAMIERMLQTVEDADGNVKAPVGGLVPHAGWVYSGAVALSAFKTLARRTSPEVVVLFGGVHRYRGKDAAMFSSGRWDTPLGPVEVDARLAERILGHTNLIADDPFAHEQEHSIEVQVPFVKYLFPEAKIVPIMVHPSRRAHEVGQAISRTLEAYRYQAVVVGSTDLTHYGPGYGFTPHGTGAEAVCWAKEENDRRFLERVCRMEYAELVDEAAANHNACSSGAAAAAVAASADLGAETGLLLAHTTSAEIVQRERGFWMNDSVGYAGIVFQ